MRHGMLFDIDGTLVLSNDAHTHAWVEALNAFGYPTSFDTVRPLIGMGADKLMPILDPTLTPENGPGKEITSLRKKLFLEKYIQEVTPSRGGRELVNFLKDQQYPCIIATSASKDELIPLLKKAQVDDLFAEYTTADDAKNSKPDPDIIHSALKKIGCDPDESFLIGDTRYDVEAAHAAGVKVIAVRCGGSSDQDLAHADWIFDNPLDVMNHFYTRILS